MWVDHSDASDRMSVSLSRGVWYVFSSDLVDYVINGDFRQVTGFVLCVDFRSISFPFDKSIASMIFPRMSFIARDALPFRSDTEDTLSDGAEADVNVFSFSMSRTTKLNLYTGRWGSP